MVVVVGVLLASLDDVLDSAESPGMLSSVGRRVIVERLYRGAGGSPAELLDARELVDAAEPVRACPRGIGSRNNAGSGPGMESERFSCETGVIGQPIVPPTLDSRLRRLSRLADWPGTRRRAEEGALPVFESDLWCSKRLV
jgi:hypothetical protein